MKSTEFFVPKVTLQLKKSEKKRYANMPIAKNKIKVNPSVEAEASYDAGTNLSIKDNQYTQNQLQKILNFEKNLDTDLMLKTFSLPKKAMEQILTRSNNFITKRNDGVSA